MMRRSLSVAVIAAALVPVFPLASQGTLSTQGFGYPPGQFSTRARATGGGISDFDPDSPLNPAAIALSQDARMFLQYEPEFRKVTTEDASSNAITARFPVVSASVPIFRRANIGISASTLLDRSASTSVTRDIEVAGTVATVTETTRLLGAINDLRFAVAWGPTSRFQIGAAIHAYTGQNRVTFSQLFPDSLGFQSISQTNTLGFRGYAGSAGIIFRPARYFGIALSGRKGAKMEAKNGDSAIAEGNVPDRYSAGIAYDGIPGTSIAVHASRELWSRMNGLGSTTAVDAWDGGVGIESLGPRIMARQTVLRLGSRYRTLPFLAVGQEVKELSFSGGIGTQFFRNRAMLDITLERAGRTIDGSDVEAKERAYILSFGLRVRP